jgi:hypothetical protein
MNHFLPNNNNLTIGKLSSVFNNTAASYKYYWFISLLQLFIARQKEQIPIKDILVKMICNAWYPINFFKLSFGFSDKLNDNIFEIKRRLNLNIDISSDELYEILSNNNNLEIKRLIMHFDQLVPYRFLSPWINGRKQEVISLSQTFSNNCLYKIDLNRNREILINPDWQDYLFVNQKILFDFAYWNLLKYLQNRNPNVPNISNKLIKPSVRNNLSKQRRFWNIVFDEIELFECIYTSKVLSKETSFDIDHFVPWSFVSHDQMWNLLPVDSSINSSKNNKLPNIEKYFDEFTKRQYQAIKIVSSKNPSNQFLEDYLVLGSSIKDIINKPFYEFKDNYYKVINPLIQIANNSGFEFWD